MNYAQLTYGKMLKQIRKYRNITQKTLAEELGITRGYVSEIETGAKQPGFALRVQIRSMHLTHCLFKKPEPLVEVMTSENSKKSLFKRVVEFLKKVFVR